MKGKELAELAMQYEDFEFEFCFVDGATGHWINLRNFENLELCSIGHSDKVVTLTGEER